jgi:hypothetical protein
MPGAETGAYGAVDASQVRAYDLLHVFGRDGRPPLLGAAFAEYGRLSLVTSR